MSEIGEATVTVYRSVELMPAPDWAGLNPQCRGEPAEALRPNYPVVVSGAAGVAFPLQRNVSARASDGYRSGKATWNPTSPDRGDRPSFQAPDGLPNRILRARCRDGVLHYFSPPELVRPVDPCCAQLLSGRTTACPRDPTSDA